MPRDGHDCLPGLTCLARQHKYIWHSLELYNEARMPRTPSIIDAVTITMRLPGADARWIAHQGKTVGNTALFLRRLVDDARNLYGLPEPIREALQAEAKKLGKDQRDYVVYLLTRRYEDLLREKFRMEAAASKPGR